jgi:hypothetical protein
MTVVFARRATISRLRIVALEPAEGLDANAVLTKRSPLLGNESSTFSFPLKAF